MGDWPETCNQSTTTLTFIPSSACLQQAFHVTDSSDAVKCDHFPSSYFILLVEVFLNMV